MPGDANGALGTWGRQLALLALEAPRAGPCSVIRVPPAAGNGLEGANVEPELELSHREPWGLGGGAPAAPAG